MKVVRLVKDQERYCGWLGSLIKIEDDIVYFDFADQTIADPRSLPIFAIIDETYRWKWLVIDGRTYELSYMTPEMDSPTDTDLRYSARLEKSPVDLSDFTHQILEETLQNDDR